MGSTLALSGVARRAPPYADVQEQGAGPTTNSDTSILNSHFEQPFGNLGQVVQKSVDSIKPKSLVHDSESERILISVLLGTPLLLRFMNC